MEETKKVEETFVPQIEELTPKSWKSGQINELADALAKAVSGEISTEQAVTAAKGELKNVK